MSHGHEPMNAGEVLTAHRVRAAVGRHPWLVVAVTAGFLLAALAYVGTRDAEYRATATLVLDTDLPQGGDLGRLGALIKTPSSLTEMAVLRSRSVAERTVRGPRDGGLPAPDHPDSARHLGLTTRVEDESRMPFPTTLLGVLGSSLADGRLFASVEEHRPGAPEVVGVEFFREDCVILSVPGTLTFMGFPNGTEIVAFLDERGTVEYRGLRLRLRAEGNVIGHPFRVRIVDPEAAVRGVIDSVQVMEVERGSGLLQISVRDTDPYRAAEIANAVCNNYIDLARSRGQGRAARAVQFIETQLDEQLSALGTAEQELVRIKESRPDTVDIESSTRSIVEQLKELELEQVRLGLKHEAFADAVALLDAGDLTALSRLGSSLDDPVSLHYIETLGRLATDFVEQDRSDTGAYRALLQRRVSEARDREEELRLEIDGLRDLLARLDDGDDSALARLVSENAVSPYLHGDRLTLHCIDAIGALEVEYEKLSQQLTAQHPDLRDLHGALVELRGRARSLIESRLRGLEEQFLDFTEIVGAQQQLLAEQPAAERERILGATEQVESMARQHLASRLSGLGEQQSDLAGHVAALEKRLARLPEGERLLAEVTRRREAHQEVVKFLLSSKQEAEISRASTVSTAQLIDPAVPPTSRHAPRVGLILAFALLSGLGCGVFLVVVRERARGTFQLKDELESWAGLAVLGCAGEFWGRGNPPPPGGEFALPIRDDTSGNFAEAFRSMRIGIQNSMGGPGGLRTLGVTSCHPGEGKTTLNACLAIAFARSGRNVLLVDGNLRNPALHQVFDLAEAPGFSGALIGYSDWRQCVVPDVEANLSVLTTGECFSAPGDLLSSTRVDLLLHEFAESYDLVIFDLPHVVGIADTGALGSRLDAMLCLVERDGTTRSALREAFYDLAAARVNLLGLILNRVDAGRDRVVLPAEDAAVPAMEAGLPADFESALVGGFDGSLQGSFEDALDDPVEPLEF